VRIAGDDRLEIVLLHADPQRRELDHLAQQRLDHATQLAAMVTTAGGTPVAESSVMFTAPAGFTVIDTFTSSIVSNRSVLFAYRIANQTGNVAAASAATDINATGRAFTLTWRDHLPLTPDELFDPVPGNHGLMETT